MIDIEIDEVCEGIFRAEIPLPNNPLKSVNTYFIKGDGRWLVVDTGMKMDACLTAFREAMRELGVDSFDLFITHLHADHMGLAAEIADGKVYMSEVEAEIVRNILKEPARYWVEVVDHYIRNGFPERCAADILRSHPGIRYTSWREIEFSHVGDGSTISIGDYEFVVVLTPGHSPGHTCLYEPREKILISGDHVLLDITPNIAWWPVMKDSLGEYLKSLDKIYNLDVRLILPGHRRTWQDLRRRVNELKNHHRIRLDEVLSVLDEPKSAWQIAPEITWDLEFDDWDELPITQKWFAFSETLAHLEHLFRLGRIGKIERDGRILYTAKVH